MKKAASTFEGLTNRNVSVYIASELTLLTGDWHWDLSSDDVFCSDVMFFPDDFLGTKAIVHPDDLEYVKSKIAFLQHVGTDDVSFRIITTYGEIKTLSAANARLVKEDTFITLNPEREIFGKWLRQSTAEQQLNDLEVLQQFSLLHQKLDNCGEWYYNASTGETWFSDNVFTIHNLAAQTLNANLHTFTPFIHIEDVDHVKDALDRSLRSHAPLEMQYRILLADQQEKHLRQSIRWTFNAKGETVLYAVLHDLSERKKLEDAYEHAEHAIQFQTKVQQFVEPLSSTAYWEVNVLTRKIHFSDNYWKIFGMKPGSTPSNFNSFINLIHADDRERVEEAWKNIIKQHSTDDLDFTIIKSNGRTAYVRQRSKALIYADKELVVIGALMDVTAEKLAEAKLNELTAQLALRDKAISIAEEATNLATFTWDVENRKMEWSDSLYKIASIKPGTIIPDAKKLINAILTEDRKAFTDALNVSSLEKIDTDITFRMIVRGEVRQMKGSLRTVGIGETSVCLGIIQDIHKEHQQNKDTRTQSSLYSAITDNMGDRIIITDNFNSIILWNKSCEDYYKRRKDEVLGKNIFEIFPSYKNEEDFGYLSRALKGETVYVSGRSVSFGKEFYDLSLIPLRDEEMAVWGVLHVLHNVTKEYHLTEQLTQRLQFIEKLLEVSVNAIVVLDRNMNVQYWNRLSEEYFGYRKEKVIGKNIMEIFPTFIENRLYNSFKRAFRGEKIHVPGNFDDEVNAYEESYVIPIKNDLDQVTGVLWITNDLSKEYEFFKNQRKGEDILNAVNSVFIELDHEFRFLFVNATSEAYLGKRKEEVLGKVIWDVLPEAVGREDYKAIVRAAEEQVKVEIEYFSAVYNRWIFMSVAPSPDGVIIFQHDRQEVKEVQHLLQQTAEATPDAITIFDLVTKKPAYLNNALAEWLGYTNQELMEMGFEGRLQLIAADDRERLVAHNQQMESAADREVKTIVYSLVSRTGETIKVSNRTKVFARDGNGKVIKILSVVQNLNNIDCD